MSSIEISAKGRAQRGVHSRQSAGMRAQQGVLLLCEGFALCSVMHFLRLQDTTGVLQSLEAMLLVLAPLLAERVFHCAISPWLHIYIMLYALGPVLGHSYKLFYTTVWWDKLLHTSAGFIFALVGFYLPLLLNKGRAMSIPMRAAFAVCFSIAVAAVWEICEFGADMLLGQDTQNDTYITEINSYFLGAAPGTLGQISQIESVIVNGVELGGYIDIGLIDTMMDIVFETAGALVAAAVFVLDRERHPAFRRDERRYAVLHLPAATRIS